MTRIARVEAAALALSLALACALMWPVRDYVTDDTFIHLQYAKNLAAGHGFVFNVGERVYGCTSPLWALLLAPAMAAGLDGLHVARALGLAATLASVILFYALVRRTLRTPLWRALATLTWAANAWMIRWSLSGMETPLAVALILAGFVAMTDDPEWTAHPARTGTLWGLAALTRPEVAALLALWGVAVVIGWRRLGARRALAGLLPALALYGGWLVFAAVYFGTLWPNTLSAKVAGSGSFGPEVFVREAQIVAATDAVLAVALLAAIVLGARRGWPSRVAPERLVPWGWIVVVPLVYAARGVPPISRYLVPLLPVLAWLAWMAAERTWADPPAKPSRVAAIGLTVATLALAQNLFWYGRAVVPQVRSFGAGMRASLIPWGRLFARHADPDASIAAPDIGAIGYYSGRRIIDLAGLVTPSMVPLLEREPFEDVTAHFTFARVERPTYLVDRAERPYDLLQRSAFARALVPLGSTTLPNLGISRPTAAVYSFYRIDWAAYDSLAAGR